MAYIIFDALILIFFGVMTFITKKDLSFYSTLLSRPLRVEMGPKVRRDILTLYSNSLETHRKSVFGLFLFAMFILADVKEVQIHPLVGMMVLIIIILISLHLSYYTRLSYYTNLEQNSLPLPAENEYPHSPKKTLKVKAALTKYFSLILTGIIVWQTFAK